MHMFRKRGFTIKSEDANSSYAEKILAAVESI